MAPTDWTGYDRGGARAGRAAVSGRSVSGKPSGIGRSSVLPDRSPEAIAARNEARLAKHREHRAFMQELAADPHMIAEARAKGFASVREMWSAEAQAIAATRHAAELQVERKRREAEARRKARADDHTGDKSAPGPEGN